MMIHMTRDTQSTGLHFQSIGLAAALILNKLRLATQISDEQKIQNGDCEADSSQGRENKRARCGKDIS
jgi:hypothetical protein